MGMSLGKALFDAAGLFDVEKAEQFNGGGMPDFRPTMLQQAAQARIGTERARAYADFVRKQIPKLRETQRAQAYSADAQPGRELNDQAIEAAGGGFVPEGYSPNRSTAAASMLASRHLARAGQVGRFMGDWRQNEDVRQLDRAMSDTTGESAMYMKGARGLGLAQNLWNQPINTRLQAANTRLGLINQHFGRQMNRAGRDAEDDQAMIGAAGSIAGAATSKKK